MKLAGSIAVVCAALVLKVILAEIAAEWILWSVYMRVAEGLMGVRTAIDGVGVGVLAAVCFIALFAASSGLAAAFAGRRRRVLAAGATAVLFSAAAVCLFVVWLHSSTDLRYDPALIAKQAYVKYPPFLAAQQLQDLVHSLGPPVLLTDIVITLVIVGFPKPRSVQKVLRAE